MLNLFQHLIKSRCYQTLNQVQGDNTRLFQKLLSVCHLNFWFHLNFELCHLKLIFKYIFQ
jgi:hypothetical protein